MMNLTNKRETFFDDAIINCERTTAEHFLHHPVRRETVLIHDQPWEGDSCFYHNFFYDNGIYRMYYVALDSASPIAPESPEKVVICYAQSKDGMHWEKPELDICEFNGSKIARNIDRVFVL